MRQFRGQVIVAGAAIAVLIGTAVAGAAVPPYPGTAIYPTEAGFQQSVAVYQRAILASPQDADAYYWLGVAYWQTSVLSRNGVIPYGDGYLQRAIDALERTVALDPKRVGAWLALEEAYATNGEEDKAVDAAHRLAALSTDVSLYTGAVPPVPRRGGPTVVILPAPQMQAPGPVGPAFRPGDFTYAGDPVTKKLYPFSCRPLPPMSRLVIFFNKWDALSQGYTMAERCP